MGRNESTWCSQDEMCFMAVNATCCFFFLWGFWGISVCLVGGFGLIGWFFFFLDQPRELSVCVILSVVYG